MVTLTNHYNGLHVAAALQEEVLSETFDLHPPAPVVIAPDGETLDEYVGSYIGRLQSVNISRTEKGLHLNVINHGGFPDLRSPAPTNPPGSDLSFEAPDAVVVGKDVLAERSEFIRDSGGRVQWYRLDGRLLRKAPMDL